MGMKKLPSISLVGLGILSLVLGTPLVSQGNEFKCGYSRKIECSASGCQETAVASAYLLLPKIDSLISATIRADGASQFPTIRRCDSKGCSPVTVRASVSGAFVNISQFDGAFFVKIGTVDLGPGSRVGDFVEVASTFLSTITYFGSCAAAVK
jgi:hypothetical protein